MTYDAIVILSFGGPEGPDDVLPFLRNVTRRRNIPDERLAVVAEQYALFGGISPINQHCRDLQAALQQELADNAIALPVYWGNRNWSPYLADTVQQMAADGVTNALVFATSAFSSYSGCRQYREDIAAAHETVGPQAPHLQKLRLFYNHPGFIEPMANNVAAALTQMEQTTTGPIKLVFTAHSIPESMAASCDYQTQLNEAAQLVASHVGYSPDQWDIVFQSRSGPPSIPWLEPDINDYLVNAAEAGTDSVVAAPIGFTSDHMEVMFDLDTQAKQTADECGVLFVRAKTVGTHPRFVAMIRELIEEKLEAKPRLSLGSLGPWPDDCPENHCLTQRPAS